MKNHQQKQQTRQNISPFKLLNLEQLDNANGGYSCPPPPRPRPGYELP